MINNADDLYKIFDLDDSEYNNKVYFDHDLGFSVRRKYPNYPECRYIPPQDKDGNPDTVVLIAIKYEKTEIKDDKGPISLRVSTFSEYLYKNFDYNFDDDKCPTRESVIISKNSFSPYEIISIGEFFFDRTKKSIVDMQGDKLTGKNLLDILYKKHVGSAHPLSKTRIKVRTFQVVFSCLEKFLRLAKWGLTFFTGRTLKNDLKTPPIGFKYKHEDMLYTKDEYCEVMGWKVSMREGRMLSLLLLLSCFVIYCTGWNNVFIRMGKHILYYPLLSLAFFILATSIYDFLMPRFLLLIINLIIKMRLFLIKKKIRV
ncbi:MAG: hypothetical protein A2017_14665 [Lentisphaerae bacterium GWF2_44_16]|nr:MAG: hypothetical protein A2017_14665 [Lentisphaerae bacterium GWF2_44_16]